MNLETTPTDKNKEREEYWKSIPALVADQLSDDGESASRELWEMRQHTLSPEAQESREQFSPAGNAISIAEWGKRRQETPKLPPRGIGGWLFQRLGLIPATQIDSANPSIRVIASNQFDVGETRKIDKEAAENAGFVSPIVQKIKTQLTRASLRSIDAQERENRRSGFKPKIGNPLGKAIRGWQWAFEDPSKKKKKD